MSIRTLVFVALLATVFMVFAEQPSVSAQEQGASQILGKLPREGWGTVGFTGGSVHQFANRAHLHGCEAKTLWVLVNGRFVSYRFAGNPIVNSAFEATFPDVDLPPGTVVTVLCEKPSSTLQGADGAWQGCHTDWPEVIERDVLPRLAVPEGICYFSFSSVEEAKRGLPAGAEDVPEQTVLSRGGSHMYYDGLGFVVLINTNLGVPFFVENLTHEFCHASQDLHMRRSGFETQGGPDAWHVSQGGQAFIEIGGWERTQGGWWTAALNPLDDAGYPQWYRWTPIEASAEICMYELNPDDRYGEEERSRLVPDPIRDWLYEYMLLPE